MPNNEIDNLVGDTVQLYDRLFRRAQKESVVLQLEDNVLKDVFVVFQPDFKNPFVCHGFMCIKINGIEQRCEFELDKRKHKTLYKKLKILFILLWIGSSIPNYGTICLILAK